MLTNQLFSFYNHLLAASLLYLSMIDPIRDIAKSLSKEMNKHHERMINVVLATTIDVPDYYKVLGVEKSATKHEIHKAFRQLAKKYHPDKNKDKGAQDEFIKIFKAYETLSDETKRKEYDDMVSGQNINTNSWQTSNINDFDVNDFFKQYEDQFVRHAHHFNQHHNQHYEQHNSHHHNIHDKFVFNGVNLDDLFHDIDEDEFANFGRLFEMSNHNYDRFHNSIPDGSFGDGASFFGSHLHHQTPDQFHDSINHNHIQHHHHQQYHRAGYSCQTTTRQVNGMVMTQTSCS